jgi:hypothetical protein
MSRNLLSLGDRIPDVREEFKTGAINVEVVYV